MKGMGMMMDYPRITQTAERVVGTRALLGQLLGKDADSIGNWISERNKPNHKDDVIRMLIAIIERGKPADAAEARKTLQALLKAECAHIKKAFLLVDPALKALPSLDVCWESVCIGEGLPYFERFERSEEDPAWEAKRRGRPAKISNNKAKMCAMPHTFKGRLLDYIRKKYDLGGKLHYKQAEALWESKRNDLMQAVNAGFITVSDAKKLLAISSADVSLQNVLSSGHKKIIRAFIQERGLK